MQYLDIYIYTICVYVWLHISSTLKAATAKMCFQAQCCGATRLGFNQCLDRGSYPDIQEMFLAFFKVMRSSELN